MSIHQISNSESETRALGKELAGRLMPDGTLLLSGDLGSGKTVLTQGVAEGMGIEYRQVQSPSFTLIREHAGPRGLLIHVDLYRLEDRDIESLGLWEILAGPGVKVVEWGEKLPFEVPEALRMTIRVLHDSHGRQLEMTDPDDREPPRVGSGADSTIIR